MSKNIRTLILCALASIALIACMAGCQGTSGVVSTAPASYLKFVGDPDVSVTVDDTSPWTLTSENIKSRFKVTPGLHQIVIHRNGNLIVDRQIMLSNGQTLEISIP